MKWLFVILISTQALAQNRTLELWPQAIPNHLAHEGQEEKELRDILWITQVQRPTIEVYLPTSRNATGQAVMICPGGGYRGLAYDWEGTDIAKWLNAQGIAGIVLKYRLPSPETNSTPHEAPLQDAQQGLRLIRTHAREWKINPQKVGVMGFSAGGHLASTLGTHFTDSATRPDFMVLIYPVVSMDPAITHQGSRQALIGLQPSTELVDRYSNELRVTTHTPSTFIVHSADDEVVPLENSLRLQAALKDNGVACDIHIFPYGGHGYSLALAQGRLGQWPKLLENWLSSLGNEELFIDH